MKTLHYEIKLLPTTHPYWKYAGKWHWKIFDETNVCLDALGGYDSYEAAETVAKEQQKVFEIPRPEDDDWK